MNTPLLTLIIGSDYDLVTARQRSGQLAGLLGLDAGDQTRVATAVSEIARNALNFGGGGKAEFFLESRESNQVLLVCISDQGPGIADLPGVLAGEGVAANGEGYGIVAARRLMDEFHIESHPGQGTVILMRKCFSPGHVINRREMAEIAGKLTEQQPQSLAEAFQQQNQELLRALETLQRREEEALRLEHELEDTNRGVLALYAELDERAERLRQADEIKSRFLSHMSHEFRTPLNAINGLTELLLSRSDGELTAEQEKQVVYIRRAAAGLIEMVNDLLDLAKVEAGKVTVRPKQFDVADLFSALRGMIRPLHATPNVALTFEEPASLPPLYTDEGKVSQILHNLISNALKFTEKGTVRVSAILAEDKRAIVFRVADTGIGIALENVERVFQEFGQLDHPIQQRVKGTGLGLPLSRKLAELLGGSLTLESQLGVGSTFCATIPLVYPAAADEIGSKTPSAIAPVPAATVLLIDDEEISHYLMGNYLADSSYALVSADNGLEGLDLARQVQPGIIFLDLVMPEMTGFRVLDVLRADPATRDIPVVVLSSKRLTEDEQAYIGAHASAFFSKENASREVILRQIREVLEDVD